MKRILGFTVALLLLVTSTFTFRAENTEHVIINQVYGASDDGYADHSFIELYNPSDKAVDMNGWSVQYRSSAAGSNSDAWSVLTLNGTIAANGYYLIRCGAVKKPSGSYAVPQGNQEWDIVLHNKGLSVALLENDMPLADSFSGDITADGAVAPEGFVDLAAVQGNDKTAKQTPPAYEGAYSGIQSKKKAIRRIDFSDTDNNAADFEAVDYSKTVSPDKQPHAGTAPVIPSYTPVETSDKQYTGFFDETSSVKAKLIARYNAGAYSADGGSAEITAYNPVNGFAYSVNGVKGTLDIVDMRGLKNGTSVKALAGTELKAAELAAGVDSDFNYGDMTSVSVSPDGKTLAVAMQDEDYTACGRVLFFDCNKDGSLSFNGIAAVGVQPDMVTFTEDGRKVLTADEGEPRQGYTSQGAVDPKGSVSVVDVSTKTSVTVDFGEFDAKRDDLVAQGVVIKKNTAPSADLEPEYIAVSGGKAYVALQEANAVAVFDINSLRFERIFSLGFEDYSKVAVDIDKSDGVYSPKTYQNIKGIRMPDGIASFTVDGATYLLTANEGDSRAWPVGIETDVNEIKSKTSPVNGIKVGGKVTWFDVSGYDGLKPETDYVFGGRSFTIFKVTESGLEEFFDSGSDFERITNDVLPSYFNCSNDTVEVEDRSGKKGPEPENVTVGTVGNRVYAFVGLERTGGVMVYDITDPANATFKNYFNSRDYSSDIRDDVSPEGLAFVSADKNGSGLPILLASNECSGTVSVIAFDVDDVPPEILNIEDGATYYVTKKAVVYNDDETPVTVTLNGEPVDEVFFLAGDREATYIISAKDSVGNEVVYTVYMKPLSSITDKISALSESSVKSSDYAAVSAVEEQLLDIAGTFDEEESSPDEWNKIVDALARCKALSSKISFVAENLENLRKESGKYSADNVSKSDREGLEKLVSDAETLLASGNLTEAERSESENILSSAKDLLKKLDGETPTQPTTPEQPSTSEEPTTPEQPTSSEDRPDTSDSSEFMIWVFVLAVSAAAVAVLFVVKKRAVDEK